MANRTVAVLACVLFFCMSVIFSAPLHAVSETPSEISPDASDTRSIRQYPALKVLPPPAGTMYHGVYPGGITGEEDDLTLSDLTSYEGAAGKQAAWVFFSHNWYHGRAFPTATAQWIRQTGSVPYIRLMLRSSSDMDIAEPLYTLARIIAGEFDADLAAWGLAARSFQTPLLVEFGTEMNGQWFSWNGIWNGKDTKTGYGDPTKYDGAERFVDAYRHIIDICRTQGAGNITWVFHVNGDDDPVANWNKLELYYPGDDYIDWIAVSSYGAQTPMETEFPVFREGIDAVHPRLRALSPSKPIVVAEFGATSGNPLGDPGAWANAALTDLTGARWDGVIGFSWWNEKWENDENPAHNTNMRIQDTASLKTAFQTHVGSKPMVLSRMWQTGDVNLDFQINAVDQVVMASVLTGSISAPNGFSQLADLNADGQNNAVDLVALTWFLVN